MRVVSVLPSATEIVFALGHGPELVGRSAECDYPEVAKLLPVVMRPRTVDSERPSAEIDARVRAARARDESLYILDVELLRALRPELLLTQDLCGVCSVTSEEVAVACARAGVRPRVVSLMPRTLEEVWATIPAVAAALGDPAAGPRLLGAVRERLPPPSSRDGPRPRVAVVEWVDPPIVAGLWSTEMIRWAGGESIGPGPGDPGERTDWNSLRDREVDLLVLSPCSFSVSRTRRELSDAALREAIARLSPRLGTFIADEAFFSRPGPRLAEGVRLLRSLVEQRTEILPMPFERWMVASPGAVTP